MLSSLHICSKHSPCRVLSYHMYSILSPFHDFKTAHVFDKFSFCDLKIGDFFDMFENSKNANEVYIFLDESSVLFFVFIT